MEQAVILSVKPVWADLIMSGHKLVELRRRFLKFSGGPVTALLYSTRPIMAMVGTVQIVDTVVLPPDDLWPRVSDYAGVTKEQYRTYFNCAKVASALFLGSPIALPCPIPLDQLRMMVDFVPPMSWRRAKPAELELVKGVP